MKINFKQAVVVSRKKFNYIHANTVGTDNMLTRLYLESVTDKLNDQSWYWQKRYYETSQNLQDQIVKISALEQQLNSEYEAEKTNQTPLLIQEHLYTDKSILVKAIAEKLKTMAGSEYNFIDKNIFTRYLYDDIISNDLILIVEISQAILTCSLKMLSETPKNWFEITGLVYKQAIEWYFWIFHKYYKKRLTFSCKKEFKLTGRKIKQTAISYLTNLAIPTIITRYRKFQIKTYAQSCC